MPVGMQKHADAKSRGGTPVYLSQFLSPYVTPSPIHLTSMLHLVLRAFMCCSPLSSASSAGVSKPAGILAPTDRQIVRGLNPCHTVLR